VIVFLRRNVQQPVREKDSSVVELPTYLALRVLFASTTRTTLVILTMVAETVAVFADVLHAWERDRCVAVLPICLVLRGLFASITRTTIATPTISVRIVAAFANALHQFHARLWIVPALLTDVIITLKMQRWMLMDVRLTVALSFVDRTTHVPRMNSG
jgi:hypothetical protein